MNNQKSFKDIPIILETVLKSQGKEEKDCISILEQLKVIHQDLAKKKLRLIIASSSTKINQGMINLFQKDQILTNHYLLSPVNLQETYPKFYLKITIPQQNLNQTINPDQTVVIGRKITASPNKNFLSLAFPQLIKLSGNHTGICCNKKGEWILTDLDSKNGTFVNGEKITNDYILKDQDHITLAYKYSNSEALEITVNLEQEKVIKPQSDLLILTDLICFIFDALTPLTEIEKTWLDSLIKTPFLKILIITDISALNPHNANQANLNIAQIHQFLLTKYPNLQDLAHNIIRISLNPLYPENNNQPIPPLVQNLINRFSEPLQVLTQQNFLQTMGTQFLRKLQFLQIQTNRYFQQRLMKVSSSIFALEKRFADSEIELLKINFRKNSQNINKERSKFSSTIRRTINTERTNISSSFIPNSLLGELNQFIQNLEVEISGNGKEVYLKLSSPNYNNAHTAIIDFCQDKTIKWGNSQWHNICNQYHQGGLEGLINRTKQSFITILPEINVDIFTVVNQQLNLEKIRNLSFVELQDQNNFKADLSMGYGAELSRAGVQGAMVAVGLLWISPVSALIQGVGLITTLAKLIGKRLKQSDIQQLKLDHVVNTLKSSSSSYYQMITRYIIDQVFQELTLELEEQEREFGQSLIDIDDEINILIKQKRLELQQLKQEEMKLKKEYTLLKEIEKLLKQSS